jgi:hypothetical protein
VPLVSTRGGQPTKAAAGRGPTEATTSSGITELASRGLDGIEQVARQLTTQPANSGATGGGSQDVRVSGTLSLNGLQEALIAATGSRSIQVDGGAPIVIDPPTHSTAKSGRA